MIGSRERAREIFPAVLLTVFGIVQALALELLWEGGAERLPAWRAAGAAAAGWAAHAAMFLGIVVIWVQFANNVMRLSWTPTIFDLVTPFVIGLLEFSLIQLMLPGSVHWWFAVFALISLVTAGVNYLVFSRALREAGFPEEATSQRGYTPVVVGSALLLVFAVATRWTGPTGAVPLLGALVAGGMLIAQLLVFHHFWKLDIFGQDPRP